MTIAVGCSGNNRHFEPSGVIQSRQNIGTRCKKKTQPDVQENYSYPNISCNWLFLKGGFINKLL